MTLDAVLRFPLLSPVLVFITPLLWSAAKTMLFVSNVTTERLSSPLFRFNESAIFGSNDKILPSPGFAAAADPKESLRSDASGSRLARGSEPKSLRLVPSRPREIRGVCSNFSTSRSSSLITFSRQRLKTCSFCPRRQ